MRPNTLFSLFLHENGYVNERKTPGGFSLIFFSSLRNLKIAALFVWKNYFW